MAKQLWLARDPQKGAFYEIYDCKPKREKTLAASPPGWWWQGSDSILVDFCQCDFERYTGIKLNPGERRKIKSIKITLEKP